MLQSREDAARQPRTAPAQTATQPGPQQPPATATQPTTTAQLASDARHVWASFPDRGLIDEPRHRVAAQFNPETQPLSLFEVFGPNGQHVRDGHGKFAPSAAYVIVGSADRGYNQLRLTPRPNKPNEVVVLDVGASVTTERLQGWVIDAKADPGPGLRAGDELGPQFKHFEGARPVGVILTYEGLWSDRDVANSRTMDRSPNAEASIAGWINKTDQDVVAVRDLNRTAGQTVGR